MKKGPSKDLIIIFLVALSYIVYIAFFSLRIDYIIPTPFFNLRIDNTILDMAYLILIFIISGYALLALIHPQDNPKALLKKPVLLLMLGALLSISVSVFLKYSPLLMDLRLLILILSTMTMIFSLLTSRRRLSSLKSRPYADIPLESSESLAPDVINYRESLKETVDEVKTSPPKIEEVSWTRTKTGFLIKWAYKTGLPLDILIIIILALVSIITVSIPFLNESILKLILGGLFVFIIPGYALLALLFPRKESLENLERLGLGVMLSLALASIIGLILNYTPLGIRLMDILLIGAVLSIISILLAYRRIKKIPQRERYSIRS